MHLQLRAPTLLGRGGVRARAETAPIWNLMDDCFGGGGPFRPLSLNTAFTPFRLLDN